MFLANEHTSGMSMEAQNDTKYKWNRRCGSNVCQIGQKKCGKVENLRELQSPRRNQCMTFRWIRNVGNNGGVGRRPQDISLLL